MGNKAIQATICGKLDNENTNLLNKFFEIPPYQRLYEWESTQIEELLNDIKKAWEPYMLQNSKSSEDLQKFIKPYFIGNIITSAKSNKGEHDKTNDKQNKIYVLIDGQQRLTTLWFIGFYLASRDCGEWQQKWKEFILQNNKLRIAMPIRDKEREALESLAKKIQKHNKEEKLEFSKDLQGIHQKIIDAFKCIESWFVSENAKDIDLAKFAECILKKVCFVFVELAQNTDLNRFFIRMNNRGKQLEKHEILKARILSVIQQGSGEWQKYAKIWDLCSDMNKYIFQSASDRKILNPKAKNDKKDNNKDDTETTEQNDKLIHLAEIAEKYTIIKDNKKAKDNGTHSGAESIIDFPTFLLHCFKIFMIDSLPQNFTIGKDKLLEFIDTDKLTWNDKRCKEFIVFMLRIRVLFDYFVIKNTLSDDGFAIMRLDSNSQPKKKIFENLAMIQNYLRVARQGERQNYHHWLTPFLKFLNANQFLGCKNKDNQSKQQHKKVGFFQSKAESFIENLKADTDNKEVEPKCIEFLENLDTNLAIAQFKDSELLDETNDTTRQAQRLQVKTLENPTWGFLNNGTGTPHYWFYRLEYYLWKWGSKRDKIDNKKIKDIFDKFNEKKFPLDSKFNFDKILNSFYFRNLNSVEHIQPQSRAKKKDWQIHDEGTKNEKRDIDCFGNLALLSVGFNSLLSNQDNADKRLDLQKKINKSEVESLKLWLVFANYPKDEDWTCKNAKKHLVQMLRVLKKSLGLNPNNSQNLSKSKETK